MRNQTRHSRKPPFIYLLPMFLHTNTQVLTNQVYIYHLACKELDLWWLFLTFLCYPTMQVSRHALDHFLFKRPCQMKCFFFLNNECRSCLWSNFQSWWSCLCFYLLVQPFLINKNSWLGLDHRPFSLIPWQIIMNTTFVSINPVNFEPPNYLVLWPTWWVKYNHLSAVGCWVWTMSKYRNIEQPNPFFNDIPEQNFIFQWQHHQTSKFWQVILIRFLKSTA